MGRGSGQAEGEGEGRMPGESRTAKVTLSDETRDLNARRSLVYDAVGASPEHLAREADAAAQQLGRDRVEDAVAAHHDSPFSTNSFSPSPLSK